MRLAVPRVPRGRADRPRRRSARGRTDLLTSRYPLAFDDRGVRAGSGRDRDPCRGRPDGAASGRRRWPPEYRCAAGCAYFASRRNAISGRFSGDLSRVSRSRMAADAPGRPRHFIAAGVNADRAGEPCFRAGNCVATPNGPGTGSAGPRRSPETIVGNIKETTGISGHDCPLCPIGGSRYVRASVAHIGPEQGQECAPYGDRNRRGGLMILIPPGGPGYRDPADPRTGQFTDLVNCPRLGVNSGLS